MRLLWMVFGLAGVLVLAGCGGGPTDSGARSDLAPPPKVDPSQAGRIFGKVTYAGGHPEPVFISMDSVPACARQHSGQIPAGDLIIGENDGLKNAFVYIKSGLSNYRWPAPQEAKKLDQKGCIYEPRVLGLMVGQPLEITNSDPSNHNINFMARDNPAFNESQPPQGETKVKTFPKHEVMVTVRCNVHPWMRAYVGVVEHPYFQVTGEDGSFSFDGLPPGDYVVEAWHERFGAHDVPITVAAGASADAEFRFPQ